MLSNISKCLYSTLETGCIAFKNLNHKYKKEILITGLVLGILGGGIALATFLSAEKFFIVNIAMLDTNFGTSVPAIIGITGMTKTGYLFVAATCTAVAGLALSCFASGLYLSK